MVKKFEFNIDMHVHSMYSGESLSRPNDIIDVALEKGLDAIVVTEHGSLRASSPFDKFRGQTTLTILRGVEISTDAGHILVYGIDDRDWDEWGKDGDVDARDLISRVNALGGVAVPAHPYIIDNLSRSVLTKEPIASVDQRVVTLSGLGAIEVCNGKAVNRPSICEMLGATARNMGLPGTGGSDAHIPPDVGRSYTAFRVPVYSNKELVAAVKNGALYPKNICTTCIPARAANISAH